MIRQQIISKAFELFLKRGFNSVTMDDLAKELAVSKKTIYKYYENKKQIVEQVAIAAEKHVHEKILYVMDSGFNPVEEYFEISKLFAEINDNIGISQLYQLKKKYPDIYDYIKINENKIYIFFMNTNLSKGIRGGYFHHDIQVSDYIVFYQSIRFYLSENIGCRKERQQLEYSSIIYHLNAICTEKGKMELIMLSGEFRHATKKKY